MAVSDKIMNSRTGIDDTGRVYKDAFTDNSKVEKEIGLSLARNPAVTKFASDINRAAKINSYELIKNNNEKATIESQQGSIGGARASVERVESLGRYVFEAMHEIEKNPKIKTKYSRVRNKAENLNPYFGKSGNKKPEFDTPLSSVKWEELPDNVKKSLDSDESKSPFKKLGSNVYDALNADAKKTILSEYRYQSEAAEGTADSLRWYPSLKGSIDSCNMLTKMVTSSSDEEEANRTKAMEAIKSAMKSGDVKTKAELGALFDIVADKHTSGDSTNLVQFDKDEDGELIDNEKNRWIKDTIAAGKPIISGPSGHTLRYLNFWAEKRQSDQAAIAGPSLEAARLVMMADLMPPKHHSYDEIMTASIGISDNSKTLTYNHKSSYEDLNEQTEDAQAPAKQAYDDAEKFSTMPENDPNIDKLSNTDRQIVNQLIHKLQNPASQVTNSMETIKNLIQQLQPVSADL